MRSNSGADLLSITCLGSTVKECLVSTDGHLVWMKAAYDSTTPSLSLEFPAFEFPAHGRLGRDHILGDNFLRNPNIHWSWQLGELGSGDVLLQNPSINCWIAFLAFPYWTLVIPLTALSAYLLLSKARVKTPSPEDRV